MILLRFPTFTHFKVRALEWLFAVIVFNMGVVLLDEYPTLDSPIFSEMIRFGPESLWQWLLLGLGALRLGALYVNGAWVPSPWVRLATALLCCTVWLWITLGIAQQGTAFLLMAVFSAFIPAELYNVARAATDARLSREARLAQPEAPAILPPAL